MKALKKGSSCIFRLGARSSSDELAKLKDWPRKVAHIGIQGLRTLDRHVVHALSALPV
jgi:hypothetical protein